MNPGERLHKYTIIRELGRGGMGGVYVAEEDVTGRQFAIKTLFKRFSEDEAYVRRFQREAQVYRQLDHPHVIGYIESGFDGGVYFIVLEYVRGKTLGEIMYDQGRLEPIPSLKIAIALAEALKHAHEKGVVHRDLKPSNVLIDESGEVKLLDFGVAHKEDQLVRTQEGTVVGTYFYAAPEQNQGKTDIDARTDIYTLGIVFYEMLVGKRPFEGDLLEVASEQAREAYAPVESMVPDIPSFVPPIIRRMMARHPESRYQTAGELLEELRAALTALTSRRAPSASLGVRPGAQVVEPDLDSGQGNPSHSIPNVPPPVAEAPPPASFQPPTPQPTPAPVVAPPQVAYQAPPQASAVSMVPPAVPAPAPVASAPGQGEADHRWHGAREAFQKRQLDQAQQLCEAVVANAPHFAQGQALLGKILTAKGHSFNAIDAFKRALALSPHDTQLHMDYAMALYTLKLPEKAREAFESVLELDPKNMLAVRYINILQQSGSSSPAPAPAPDPAAAQGGLGRSSLHGDVYQAPVASAPAARPQPEFGTSTAIGRLENFLAGANASAAPGASSLPPKVSMTPPPKPTGAPPHSMPPPSPSSVSLPPPPSSSVTPPMPSSSAVSIPPPVRMPGSGEVSMPVPSVQSMPPPASYAPPTPPPASVPAPLKRTPEYMTPPKPISEDEPPAVQQSDGERREKRRKKRGGDEKLRFEPNKAWTLGTLWWGMGAGYLGMSSRAFMLTLLEVVVLGMVIVPLTQPDIVAAIHKTKLSLVPFADWLADNGMASPGRGIYSFLYELNKDLAPPINDLIADMGSDLMMGLGAILFFWFEFTLPSGFQRVAQMENLLGRVLEVRRDMTLKISLGEERGVEEGMIFRVEKRKHVDALSQLNFKTLISAPQVFPIGRAKVTSVAPTFAICQFRRYPGQSSSPSAGDQVVIMKANS